MPLRDVAAMNASLDNDYGPTRGPASPSSHALALFVGDPMTPDGLECTDADDPGYARTTVTAAMWNAADAGFKSTDPILMPTVTGPWLDEPTHWALFDGSTMWDCGPLVEPLAITAAGPGPQVTVTIFYDDTVSPV